MARLFKPKTVTVDKNLMKFLYYGEQVKKIEGTEHYFVTSYGRVFSGKIGTVFYTLEGSTLEGINWRQLKPRLIRGYYAVDIGRKTYYVHRLVYEAYQEKVDTTVLKVVHIDGDKLNNKINNLGLAWRRKKDYQSHIEYCSTKAKRESILNSLKVY